MATAIPTTVIHHIKPRWLSPLTMIVIGFALLEVALWTPARIQLWPSLAAASWIIVSTALSGDSADELGLARRGFRESTWIVLAAVAVGLLILYIGWLFGWLHPLSGLLPPLIHAASYSFWAFQQQFILQSFFTCNLLRLTTTRRAVLVSATLFSLAHLPNPILVAATLFTGLLFAAAFARYRNIYALAIAHAVLGLAVAVSLPADLHRNMRVGLGYFTYRSINSARDSATPAADRARPATSLTHSDR